jgi:hypothetical protein
MFERREERNMRKGEEEENAFWWVLFAPPPFTTTQRQTNWEDYYPLNIRSSNIIFFQTLWYFTMLVSDGIQSIPCMMWASQFFSVRNSPRCCTAKVTMYGCMFALHTWSYSCRTIKSVDVLAPIEGSVLFSILQFVSWQQSALHCQSKAYFFGLQ